MKKITNKFLNTLVINYLRKKLASPMPDLFLNICDFYQNSFFMFLKTFLASKSHF